MHYAVLVRRSEAANSEAVLERVAHELVSSAHLCGESTSLKYKEVKLPRVTQNVVLTVASYRTWRG